MIWSKSIDMPRRLTQKLRRIRKVLLLASAVALSGLCPASLSTANASQPEANSLSVIGVQRGQSVEVQISGARLGDARELLFYTPGLTASNITKVDDNNIKVTISAAADAKTQLHPFRVITATGTSNMRLFGVSSLPTVAEVEPNSEFAKAQEIPFNSTIDGVVLNEDVDYYSVELEAGQRLNVELEGLRHAYLNNFFDPYVAIYDANRFEITASDDSVFLQQDCLCSMVAPAKGRYIIEVRESSFGGNDQCKYRLHIGGFPRPVAILPSGGPAGQPLAATCIDLLGNTWQETFEMPTEARTKSAGVWSQQAGLIAPSPNMLRINALANVLETEPNSDYNAIPTSHPVPVAFNGILETDQDRDFWVFEAKKDQQLDVNVFARTPLRSQVDPVLQIFKVGAGGLASNDDQGGPDSYLSFKVPEDGKYAVCVSDHLGRGGKHFVYRVEVAVAEAEVGTTVNEQERYISQVVNIPKGARMAIEANLARKNVGGEGRISIPDMLAGATHSDGLVAADQSLIQMIFRAAPDAANGSKLVDLSASLAISPEKTLTGFLNQRTQLIRGQNNVDVWGMWHDRLAVNIVDAVPFDIEIVQPQVPIVRNGSMSLTINTKRNPGFDKPINVRLLTAPPGIGASPVTIPGDQSTVAMSITANNQAAIRKSPILVLATTDSGFGPVTIASEFVELDVQDALFQFKFNKTMAEQGKSADVVVGIELKGPTEGTVEVEILGLPPGTTCATPKLAVPADAKQLVFPLTIPAETRAGNYKTIVARGTVTSAKGLISQTNGNAEVQIDVPVAPPAAPAAAPAAPMPTPPPAAPTEKPLSRLEQLRQQKGNKQ
ncbi:MAG: pre-peptidase C-terminal domain-containing protein [Pirellula sp.]